MTRQQTPDRESHEPHESLPRFASHRQLAERAAARPPGYLLDLERIIVRRDAEGIWFDAAVPVYAELCAKYRPVDPPPSSLSPQPSDHWQEWRAQGGRWVAVGYLQPGYAADPPQFDPLPGEVLSTPALPVEDFR